MSTNTNEYAVGYTIEEAVRYHLPHRHLPYAREATRALETRERDITASLLRYADEAGGDVADVEAFLVRLGMAMPLPDVAASGETEPDWGDVLAEVRQLGARVSAMYDRGARALRALRRQGMRV